MCTKAISALANYVKARNAELIRKIDATSAFCDVSNHRMSDLDDWMREHGYVITPPPPPAPRQS